MATGGNDPPSGKRTKLSRADPEFLQEQMEISGMFGEEEEELVFTCLLNILYIVTKKKKKN